MGVNSATVAAVLDLEYGERLFELTPRMSVWILESPVNVAAAREFWKQTELGGHTVTTFKSDDFEGLIDNIELHHGGYSQTSPFHQLEVIGLKPNPEVHSILGKYGFTIRRTREGGFVAVRSPEV